MIFLYLILAVIKVDFIISSLSDSVRYSPYSSFFNNQFDYADAESYSVNLFTNLLSHMNAIKRDRSKCDNIPVPKTILNKKYFNPEYELVNYKNWFPPKDHLHVIFWSQMEAYRNSLFLSYSLQDENARFPLG